MAKRRRDDDLAKRITIDPAVCNGKPTLRGKRITVQTVLEFLSAGESRREILRQYPSLESEDIDACLAFAARLMGYGFADRLQGIGMPAEPENANS